MFTPQQKRLPRWSLTPRAASDEGVENGSVSRGGVLALGKGKSAVEALMPPPQASLGENGGGGFGVGDAQVWQRFQEAGMLDEASLQRKDREALVYRLADLEKELHEYQYNMGLLLIEKKEWVSKYDEVQQILAEAEETLKREQSAHLIAVSEFEKREDNLRKALGVEKQCVADLERAIREIHSEIEEMKFTSDKKLDEAHALEAGLEEKYLEIEGKLHSADAKLAEASRRSLDAERKLEDLEAREKRLQKEQQSLSSERKRHEKDSEDQREHLHDWEKKLQDTQKRLLEGQQLLNEREDWVNEADRTLRKKETEFEDTRKSIEATWKSLKSKEEDITIRLSSLAAKEEESFLKIEELERKEKELVVKEQIVDAREKLEIQKVLDDYNAKLACEKDEFELDLEKRRRSFDEEIKVKLSEVEKNKKEVDRMEGLNLKRERALEIDMQKLKDWEKDLDSKSKALKKWEESVKNDENKLEKEKQQLQTESEELIKSKAELESLKTSIEVGKYQIIREEENLRLTQDEREKHIFLQSKLKQEIEEYRMMKETLLQDSKDLRQQKQKFEEEWEVLDEKRLALETDTKKFDEEREKFEKWRCNEKEKLKSKELEARANMERDLQDLMQKKEVFEKTMEHERFDALDMLKRERTDITRELELRKHELEMDMQKRREDMEKMLQDRENEFRRKRDIDLNQIKSLSSLNDLKIQKLKLEQDRLEREKEDLSSHRRKLEADQVEIQKDIDALHILSRNLKDQREEFIKEKDCFLALAEQCKTCKNCGLPVSELELELLGLQDAGNIQLPNLGFHEQLKDNNVETPPLALSHPKTSGGRTSWLQKCSRLFNFSPGKKADVSLGTRLDKEVLDGETSHEAVPSYGVGVDSLHIPSAQPDVEIRVNEEPERLGEAGEEPELSLGVADNSSDILRIHADHGVSVIVDKQTVPSGDQKEMEGYAVCPENGSQPDPAKLGQCQPSRRGRAKGVRRTHSVKAVVEDAKAILGEVNECSDIQEDSQGDSVHGDTGVRGAGQKRRLAYTSGLSATELDGEDSEARSESVSLGGRRKRRQISAPGTQTPGERRYNFRRSTVVGAISASQRVTDQSKATKTGELQPPTENKLMTQGGTSKPGTQAADFVADSTRASNMLQKTALEGVTGIQEVSSQKVVQNEMEEVHADAESNGDVFVKSVDYTEQSGENGQEVDGGATADSEPGTPPESEDDGDDEDEEFEKHNASIGKKLWTFFTT